jgi:hypothetical protein
MAFQESGSAILLSHRQQSPFSILQNKSLASSQAKYNTHTYGTPHLPLLNVLFSETVFPTQHKLQDRLEKKKGSMLQEKAFGPQ